MRDDTVRTRLRPAYSADELAQLYATPHEHTRWADHVLRVITTIGVAQWMIGQYQCRSVADLSCGDATIARALNLPVTVLGDLAPGYDVRGPIEQTLDTLDPVDLFVCSETVEHLDDPDEVLRRIAGKADTLVLSTPIGETDTGNPEHYWGWDVEDVTDMLVGAGWSITTTVIVKLPGWTYSYQIHGCRKRGA
jgi:hypothetical protein